MRANETALERNRRVFDVENPVALVTGSLAPRVGRTVGEYLHAHGFRVVLHGRHEPTGVPQAASVGTSSIADWAALIVRGSIESEDQVLCWREQIWKELGRLDLLVNSAAIWEPKKLELTSAEDFEHFFRVNCVGPALACKQLGLAMAEQSSGGAIVNLGDWAIARPYPDFSAYFASKGALVALTQTMAVELAERNPRVRVNAILPGPVLLAESIDDSRREQIREQCLLKREGTAADVAEAVLYLATGQFVTGVCLPVDGGRTIYPGASTDLLAHPRVSRAAF